MNTERIENNQVTISGEIISNFEFSHKIYGEGFYTAQLAVRRLSETEDVIPITVSDRLVDVTCDWVGEFVTISGQFRSYNLFVETKYHLVLSVFTKELHTMLEDDARTASDINQIYFDGYICKRPTFRRTPSGREISDILLAVNRPYGKSDYIPCTAWGRNARFAESLEVGTRLKIWGRIQSREYQKKISDDECETRVAFEVSVSKLEVVEETEE